jgi:hypothetical protein
MLEQPYKTKPNMLVPWYLMSAYAYYILDDSFLSDAEFDSMAKELLKVYDTVEHRHKYLITKEDLKAGTLMLSMEEYPPIVRGAAEHLLALKQEQEKRLKRKKRNGSIRHSSSEETK